MYASYAQMDMPLESSEISGSSMVVSIQLRIASSTRHFQLAMYANQDITYKKEYASKTPLFQQVR
jgi:hypothetical protein